MTTMILYTGGGVTFSPRFEEGRTQSAYVRLVAGEGKALQKGDIISPCVDVLASDVPNWTEVDAPPEPEPDLSPEEALSILLGGDGE